MLNVAYGSGFMWALSITGWLMGSGEEDNWIEVESERGLELARLPPNSERVKKYVNPNSRLDDLIRFYFMWLVLTVVDMCELVFPSCHCFQYYGVPSLVLLGSYFNNNKTIVRPVGQFCRLLKH